jgi:hypothetical protein
VLESISTLVVVDNRLVDRPRRAQQHLQGARPGRLERRLTAALICADVAGLLTGL